MPMIINQISLITMYSCSSAYHVCKAHSRRVSEFMLRVDLNGIIIVLFGSNHVTIQMISPCRDMQSLKNWLSYSNILISLMLVTIFFSDRLSRLITNSMRVILFAAQTSLAVSPTILSFFMPTVDPQMWKVITTCSIILGGGYLYAIHWPEKHHPKIFDILG